MPRTGTGRRATRRYWMYGGPCGRDGRSFRTSFGSWMVRENHPTSPTTQADCSPDTAQNPGNYCLRDVEPAPVPRRFKARETGPARKTGGLGGHRGRPMRRPHAPARPRMSPRQQPCGVTTDDPMPFAFADPLPLPAACSVVVLFHNRERCPWAPDVAAGQVPDTLGDRRTGDGCGPPPVAIPSAS